jgi:hypothetical protein
VKAPASSAPNVSPILVMCPSAGTVLLGGSMLSDREQQEFDRLVSGLRLKDPESTSGTIARPLFSVITFGVGLLMLVLAIPLGLLLLGPLGFLLMLFGSTRLIHLFRSGFFKGRKMFDPTLRSPAKWANSQWDRRQEQRDQ